MVGLVAIDVEILKCGPLNFIDQAKLDCAVQLAIEVWSQRLLHYLVIVLRIWEAPPQPVLTELFLGELVQQQLDNIVDQHEGKAVEISVTHRELIKRKVQLVDAVREKLDHRYILRLSFQAQSWHA